MAQHRDPNWTPGRGTLCPIITLSPEAETAYQAWIGIRAVAADPSKAHRLHRDEIDRIIIEEYDTVLGRLLDLAVQDAETRPLGDARDRLAGMRAGWEVIGKLAALTYTLAPPAKLTSATEDTCRHGRPYSGDCADCDTEI